MIIYHHHISSPYMSSQIIILNGTLTYINSWLCCIVILDTESKSCAFGRVNVGIAPPQAKFAEVYHVTNSLGFILVLFGLFWFYLGLFRFSFGSFRGFNKILLSRRTWGFMSDDDDEEEEGGGGGQCSSAVGVDGRHPEFHSRLALKTHFPGQHTRPGVILVFIYSMINSSS